MGKGGAVGVGVGGKELENKRQNDMYVYMLVVTSVKNSWGTNQMQRGYAQFIASI